MNEQNEVRRHHKRELPNDAWYHDRDKYHNVISFNGSGRSGKTTLSRKLASENHGIHVKLHTLRDRFEREIYRKLQRTDEQRNSEIYGISSFGWMLAEFHWRVKDYLNEGETIICDHFFFDYYVEMMPESESISAFKNFLRSIYVPRLDRGFHFYLDIDFLTYCERSNRLDLVGKPIKELNTIREHIFNERRERYLKLCDAKMLIYVDATTTIKKTYDSILGHI